MSQIYFVVEIGCIDDSEVSVKTWEAQRAYDFIQSESHEGMSWITLEVHEIHTDFMHEIPIQTNYYYDGQSISHLEGILGITHDDPTHDDPPKKKSPNGRRW